MLTTKQFEGLKKTNLSVDAQKSRERISSAYKAASSEVKKAIHSLSGLTQNTFYNAFQKGSASPRMVLAMAQTLGTSPYYYTGESDDKGKFSEDVLKSFLSEKKLAVTARKAGRAAKKAAAAATAAIEKVKPVKKRRKAAVKAAPVKAAKAVKVKAAPKAAPKKAAAAPKAAASKAAAPENNEVFIQVSIPKSPKLQKAIANLDEEGAVLLLRALIRKADASDQAKALCDIIKSCLLS
jgi:hypothetical protein